MPILTPQEAEARLGTAKYGQIQELARASPLFDMSVSSLEGFTLGFSRESLFNPENISWSPRNRVPADPNYNALQQEDVSRYKGDRGALLAIAEAGSHEDFVEIQRRIEIDKGRQALMGQAPVASVFGMMAGGVASPENFLPIATALRLWKTTKGVKTFVGNSAAFSFEAMMQSSMAELMLTRAQPSRTETEALFNVMGSVAFSNLLGGINHGLSKGRVGLQKRALAKRIDHLDENHQVLDKMLKNDEFAGSAGAAEAEARYMARTKELSDPTANLLAGGGFVQRFLKAALISPVGRGIQSISPTMRGMMRVLTDTPILVKDPEGQVVRMSTESLVNRQYHLMRRALFDTIVERGKMLDSGIAEASEWRGAGGSKRFYEAVGDAMKNGDRATEDVAEALQGAVTTSAKRLRKEFDRTLDELDEVGLLSKSEVKLVDSSYLHRAFNLEEIKKNRQDFTSRLAEWFNEEGSPDPQTQAEEVVAGILGDPWGVTATGLNKAGQVNIAGPLKDPTLLIPSDRINDFLIRDVSDVMFRYMHKVGPQIELTRMMRQFSLVPQIDTLTNRALSLSEGIADGTATRANIVDFLEEMDDLRIASIFDSRIGEEAPIVKGPTLKRGQKPVPSDTGRLTQEVQNLMAIKKALRKELRIHAGLDAKPEALRKVLRKVPQDVRDALIEDITARRAAKPGQAPLTMQELGAKADEEIKALADALASGTPTRQQRRVAKRNPRAAKAMNDAMKSPGGSAARTIQDLRDAGQITADAARALDNLGKPIRGLDNATAQMQRIDERMAALRSKAGILEDKEIRTYVEAGVGEVQLAERIIRIAADLRRTHAKAQMSMKGMERKIRNQYERGRIDKANAGKKVPRNLSSNREQRDIDDLRIIRDRLLNNPRAVFDADPDNWALQMERGVQTFNYATMLGGVVVSSLPDVAMPTFVNGFRPHAAALETFMRQPVNEIAKVMRPERLAGGQPQRFLETLQMRDELVSAAIGSELIVSAGGRSTLLHTNFEGTPFERGNRMWGGLQEFASRLFGSSQWNAGGRVVGTLAAMNRVMGDIEKWVSKTGGGLDKTSQRNLREIGIDEGIARQIWREVTAEAEDGGGGLVGQKEIRSIGEQWFSRSHLWKDSNVRRVYESGIISEVNRTVIAPGIGEKPRVLSVPFARLLFQFRSFSIAATHRLLAVQMQRHDFNTTSGMLMLMSFGAVSYYARELLAGREPSTDPRTIAGAAVDRSGVVGWLGDLNGEMDKQFNLGLSRFFGAESSRPRYRAGVASMAPALRKFEDLFSIIRQVTSDAGPTQTTAQQVNRMISPLSTLWYTRYLMDRSVDVVSGDVFGLPEDAAAARRRVTSQAITVGQ